MKVEEISEHGRFSDQKEAYKREKELQLLEGNDNLTYITKIENGEFVVVLLAGLSDDSILGDF